MKNKFLLCIALVTMMLTSGIAVKASTTEPSVQTDVEIEVGAGIKPGSFLYGIDKGWESLVLKFVGDEKEAELLLKYAEERLSELNELDDEDAEKYADELYQEYGANLEKVSEKIAEKIATGKVELKIRAKLDRAAELDEAVDYDKVDKVSVEIKVKVNNAQTKSYAITIVTDLDQTKVEELKAQGYGYGEIIKLQAFADLSGKTIEELMFLDIYITTEARKKEIDYGKLALELGIVIENELGEVKPDLEAVKQQFKAYRDVVKGLREELKDKAEAERETFKLEMEARLRAARLEFSQKVETRLIARFAEFNSKIEEIYNDKVQIINNLDDTVVSADVKAELILKLDEVKTELLLEVTKQVEEGELSPRDYGRLNAEIHIKFNRIFDEELSDEVKEELQDRFDDVINQLKPIFDELIVRFETRHKVTLSEEQISLVWLEIEAKINEIDESKKADLIEDLYDKVNNMLDDLLEESNEVNVNIDGIFDELLNNEMIQNRLGVEAYAEFKQQLIDAKAEIIAEVNEGNNEFRVRMELYQEIMDRLEEYLEVNDYTNPHSEEIFDKVINSTLFRVTSRLSNSEFVIFKQQLMDAKAEILAEIDLNETNVKIELELTKSFAALLKEFKDSYENIEITRFRTSINE
ncbi:MAG: hypothetical protein K0Q49_583 [Haloplasmataceae bacterium]|jgi:hypothetical protein|nr:hypothetical protein [Haloplasmataceae bacterium]